MFQDRQNFLSRCIKSVRENLCLRAIAIITPTISFTTTLYLLDYVCDQKMQNKEIDWMQYATFENIFSLVMGVFNETFILISLPSLAKNEIIENNSAAQFAGKALAITTMTAGVIGAKKILTCEIADFNQGYAAGSIAIETFMYSSFILTGSSIARRENIFILPITQSQIALVTYGIALATSQEFLNLVIDQMMKQNFINWNTLTGSEKSLAWNGIQTILFGLLGGELANLTNKYVTLNSTFACSYITYTVATVFFISFQYANSPGINKDKTGLITAHGLINGVPLGTCIALGIALFSTKKEANALRNQPPATLLEYDEESQPGSLSPHSR